VPSGDQEGRRKASPGSSLEGDLRRRRVRCSVEAQDADVGRLVGARHEHDLSSQLGDRDAGPCGGEDGSGTGETHPRIVVLRVANAAQVTRARGDDRGAAIGPQYIPSWLAVPQARQAVAEAAWSSRKQVLSRNRGLYGSQWPAAATS
jgi:hypothetical protein